MILYVVKTSSGYLKKVDSDSPLLVSLDKASVFSALEEAMKLRDRYGEGEIAELTLTEKVLTI